MLIVNLHTLQTVYILNFIHDIFLYSRRTFDRQNISRSGSTIRQRSTGTNVIVLLYKNLFRQRNKIFLHFTGLRSNDDLTITTFHLTHSYLTIYFRYNSRIRRVTCFKQLCNTRKTTGNITSLTYGTRNLNDYLTSFHLLTIFDHDVSTYR